MSKFINFRDRFTGNQYINVEHIIRVLPARADMGLPVRIELTLLDDAGRNVILQTNESYEDVIAAIEG